MDSERFLRRQGAKRCRSISSPATLHLVSSLFVLMLMATVAIYRQQCKYLVTYMPTAWLCRYLCYLTPFVSRHLYLALAQLAAQERSGLRTRHSAICTGLSIWVPSSPSWAGLWTSLLTGCSDVRMGVMGSLSLSRLRRNRTRCSSAD